MKLERKLAGTVLLPLAAAAMATNVQAADLSVGGYVAAQVYMSSLDGASDKSDTTVSAATSRLSVKTTNIGDADATVLIEGDFFNGRDANTWAPNGAGKLRARHAVVFVDGWAVGQTWSPAANLHGLLPNIDFVAYTGGSVTAGRTAQITKVMNLGDGMTLKVGIEDNGKASASEDGASFPDLAAGFTGKFGPASVFVGGKLVNANETATTDVTQYVHLTSSVKMDLDGFKVVGAFTTTGDDETGVAEYTAVSAGASMGLGDGLSLNAMYETKMPEADGKEDQGTLFVNAFYKMPSGLQFGAELQSVTNKGYADGEDLTIVALQGKFAF